jgi:brefeldin A-inhibited guanine nucleotide-exchange protein
MAENHPSPDTTEKFDSRTADRPVADDHEVHAEGEEEEEVEPSAEVVEQHDISPITEEGSMEAQEPAQSSGDASFRPTDEAAVGSSIATPRTVVDSSPPTPAPGSGRQRTDSQSTTATNATRTTARSTRSSLVFVIAALDNIAASKDARKRKPLADSVQRALTSIRTAQGDASQINPEVLFEPLNLATEASTVAVVVTALDCIGKLISYSYFSAPAPTEQVADRGPPLIERAIDTICDCFQGEATPVEIQMQIIKSLLAAILNDKIVVHGQGLLKSVRQTYNIFLMSKSSANQQIAQGTLTQMVSTVFERVKARLTVKATRVSSSRSGLANGAADEQPGVPGVISDDDLPAVSETESPAEMEPQPKMTLQTFETQRDFDDARITDAAPTTVSRAKKSATNDSRTASGSDIPTITIQGEDNEAITEDDEEDEFYIRDAFLVFRAMCKLSTKMLRPEETADIKSQGMRSKLLSLHIIHTVIFNHHEVFTSPLATIKSSSNGDPTGFITATKQYLCLSLSRNGASSANRVFEVASEIFWLVLRHLRSQLKRELEVFLKEVYLGILEKRAAPAWQKSYIVQHIFGRLAADSKALVEVYLNYDCDRQALDNMFQRIIEHLSRIAGQPVTVNGVQQQAYNESLLKQNLSMSDWRERGTLPPSLTINNISPAAESDQNFPAEYATKMQGLECLIEVLRSMVDWSQQSTQETAGSMRPERESRFSVDDARESIDTRGGENNANGALADSQAPNTPLQGAEDDPEELQKVKIRKTALNNAVRQFNFKPKRGLKTLIAEGFIASSEHKDIAQFFLANERIDKTALGEFLGDGDEENIKIMHAFVDLMDFTKTRFVTALRRFLQAFRLPGEAQKIDRLVLKFAERYVTGNPNAFANADTAYVLAYSVIMLNVDQHSVKVKKRMTHEDFIKNNRGINDNANLPDEYLVAIFDEIAQDEIVLDTEREKAADMGMLPQAQGTGLVNTLANVGRDLQREAYAQASEEMSNRTEQLFKNMLRAQRRNGSTAATTTEKGRFLTASSFKHVGPMFSATWMSFLTALSGSAQETQNLETIRLCMDGQKMAIRIACLFDLEDPRQAFVSSLGRNTNLYNLSEMKAKNVEALRALLDIAYSEGNLLKESWRDVLTCISQLDRFQLISSGVHEDSVPDMLRAQSPGPRKSMQLPRRPPVRPNGGGSYQADIAEESRGVDMIRSVDRIFTNTANLSGDAIVDFVKALVQVSWQEIQSSGLSDTPRTYSLQKIVEISGYNMLRVRFEWTSIWQVLGQHFIDVGCHNNAHVVPFALNSLRQLSMRFMEIEELPGFKFQKDFLKPFELILSNASQVPVKDLVLRCLSQMIQARGDMIRSGWRTMFGVFTVAAREPYEGIVNLAFDNVTQVYNERFGVVISQGAFSDLVVCLTEFSKNMKFQKKSLQAIETLKASVPKMLRTPECPLSQQNAPEKDAASKEGGSKQLSRQTSEEQYWFPVLFAFHDVLMTGEDLEVRSRALNYLFDTLTRYGRDFPRDFWDTLWRQLLYPIFMVLKDRRAISQEAASQEELSVWLSTTLIQALRNMISLFTHFFNSLEYMLDRFLDLLALCICQENDTLARIGSNCLQQLILQNVTKFSPAHWEKIVGSFVELFNRTEAKELFSAATSSSYSKDSSYTNGTSDAPKSAADDTGSFSPANALKITIDSAEDDAGQLGNGRARSLTMETTMAPSISGDSETSSQQQSNLEDFGGPSLPQRPPVVVTAARRRYFNQIITKCVLQLLMIETVSELFSNDAVYASIPSHLLLRLMALLKKSYHFAKRFNEDRELRTRLYSEGFMRQAPNLLKQESGSASVYVLILLRMYADTSDERAASRPETEAALIPLCTDIIASYIALDEETQQRNIVTWRPVVIDVLEGYTSFASDDFSRHAETFAPLAVGLMGKEVNFELQRTLQGLWMRICEVKLGINMASVPGLEGALPTPTSPRATSEKLFGASSRRGSKGKQT